MTKQPARNSSAYVHQFTFDPSLDLADVEYVLDLALAAVTAMSGEAAVRLGFAYSITREQGTVTIDARNEVGINVVLVFIGLSVLAFGADAVRVERLHDRPFPRITRRPARRGVKTTRTGSPHSSRNHMLPSRCRNRGGARQPARSPR